MSYDNSMYFDNGANRSPNSQRLGRQSSRQQFQEYHPHVPSGLGNGDMYGNEAYTGRERYADMRNQTIGGYGGGYDMGGQTWNAGAFTQNHTMNGYGGQSLRKPASRGGRAGLPSAWLDQQQMDMNPYLGGGGMRQNGEQDDDLIPTAIVIKNIPFAIKKEQLSTIMGEMGLPMPYAFNYHFDNGVFRGLAFANFTNPDETATVIDAMNHFELNGRKLRVEYKKMLPAAERERIEREKRERRGQLEEQHRPMVPTLHTQSSMNSMNSRTLAHSPSPVSARNLNSDVDLNDPQVLQFYSKLLLFKEDPARDLLVFAPTLSPQERRIVHTIAHHMALLHTSKGDADHRAVHVYKENSRARISPPMPHITALRNENHRSLNRAATTDFSDVRMDPSYYSSNSGLRHQASAYLGGYQDAGSSSLGPNNNLRAAKSFADLRSYTPSPVPSTASFPTALSNNVARLQDFGRDASTQSTTPILMTPTSGLAERGENPNNLINGLGAMSLGPSSNSGGAFGGSPRGLRGFASWENAAPGPIGSHRSFSNAYDERSQSQRRGPVPERGFPRRNGNGHMARNSDELSQQSSANEIAVEH